MQQLGAPAGLYSHAAQCVSPDRNVTSLRSIVEA
jgi:hypothetical protein